MAEIEFDEKPHWQDALSLCFGARLGEHQLECVVRPKELCDHYGIGELSASTREKIETDYPALTEGARIKIESGQIEGRDEKVILRDRDWESPPELVREIRSGA